jgi:hypothetical protein
MIHILTYPARLIDRLRYQIYGTMPTISGEDMRPGPMFIELIRGDTCTMIPTESVVHIYFDSGYHGLLARNRKESNENLAAQMGGLAPQPKDPDEDVGENVPYDAGKVPKLRIEDQRDFG